MQPSRTHFIVPALLAGISVWVTAIFMRMGVILYNRRELRAILHRLSRPSPNSGRNKIKNILRYASSFIAPVVMTILLPYLVLQNEHRMDNRSWLNPSLALVVLGLLVTAAGLILFFITARMFILIGRGTIMPWDPTRKLIIAGVYQYMRNPMILAVLTIEIGLALVFGSPGIALVAAIFFVVNTIYFIFSEEPGLEKRFGEEYVEYKRNVPRWIPRRTPWQPKR